MNNKKNKIRIKTINLNIFSLMLVIGFLFEFIYSKLFFLFRIIPFSYLIPAIYIIPIFIVSFLKGFLNSFMLGIFLQFIHFLTGYSSYPNFISILIDGFGIRIIPSISCFFYYKKNNKNFKWWICYFSHIFFPLILIFFSCTFSGYYFFNNLSWKILNNNKLFFSLIANGMWVFSTIIMLILICFPIYKKIEFLKYKY